MHPADHLRPLYRRAPNNNGGFTIALDPREAEFILARGWATLDGVRYRTSLDGETGETEMDGRIVVRCQASHDAEANAGDPTDRWSLRLLRLLRAA